MSLHQPAARLFACICTCGAIPDVLSTERESAPVNVACQQSKGLILSLFFSSAGLLMFIVRRPRGLQTPRTQRASVCWRGHICPMTLCAYRALYGPSAGPAATAPSFYFHNPRSVCCCYGQQAWHFAMWSSASRRLILPGKTLGTGVMVLRWRDRCPVKRGTVIGTLSTEDFNSDLMVLSSLCLSEWCMIQNTHTKKKNVIQWWSFCYTHIRFGNVQATIFLKKSVHTCVEFQASRLKAIRIRHV